jgi:hypothetical protein
MTSDIVCFDREVTLARSAREMGLRCKRASKTLRRDSWRVTLVMGGEGTGVLI